VPEPTWFSMRIWEVLTGGSRVAWVQMASDETVRRLLIETTPTRKRGVPQP